MPRPGEPIITPWLKRQQDEKLWAKVSIADCWTWQGATDTHGYGRLWNGERQVLAHRAVFEILTGEAPPFLDHLCRRPPCVNPDHLQGVTHGQNVRRGSAPSARVAKTGRFTCGHPTSSENTYEDPSGGRTCLRCKRQRKREWRARRREQGLVVT